MTIWEPGDDITEEKINALKNINPANRKINYQYMRPNGTPIAAQNISPSEEIEGNFLVMSDILYNDLSTETWMFENDVLIRFYKDGGWVDSSERVWMSYDGILSQYKGYAYTEPSN